MKQSQELSNRVTLCAHASCSCPVNGKDPFCSAWCRDVTDGVLKEQKPCQCGHEDCMHDR